MCAGAIVFYGRQNFEPTYNVNAKGPQLSLIRGLNTPGFGGGPGGYREQFLFLRVADINGDGFMDLISAEPGEVDGVACYRPCRHGMVQALYGPFLQNSDIPFSHWYTDWAAKIFDPTKTRIVKFTAAFPLGGIRRQRREEGLYDCPILSLCTPAGLKSHWTAAEVMPVKNLGCTTDAWFLSAGSQIRIIPSFCGWISGDTKCGR